MEPMLIQVGDVLLNPAHVACAEKAPGGRVHVYMANPSPAMQTVHTFGGAHALIAWDALCRFVANPAAPEGEKHKPGNRHGRN